MKLKLERSFIREILEHTDKNTISFAGGLPDISLFPQKALQESAYKALEEPEALQYGRSTGYEPLKEQIATLYNKQGFPTERENIIITSGSQQALDIICRYHAAEGIAIEQPSYVGALNIFKLNNMQVNPVALDESGIDTEEFKKALSSSKLAYLIPDFQNPSGGCYSQSSREKVAKALKQSGGILIEDSPYSELYFEKREKSISQQLPEQSYHLGSFSKVLAPALRIGWIRASKELLEPLIAYKEIMDLHTSTITQRVVSQYLKNAAGYESHLQKLREEYHNKMLHFTKQLDRHLPNFEYTTPKGGMFIYGRLKGVNTMQLVQLAIKCGVVFVPGSVFGGAEDEIRFNFTNSSFEEIEEGLKKLKSHLCTDLFRGSFYLANRIC
ncbi:MAG TPA: PLP-dependent aminotransferase family protein [Nitratifractor sp.]|nr:PLP-dependent aminotransferase family protein [Nitratifractor sp.]